MKQRMMYLANQTIQQGDDITKWNLQIHVTIIGLHPPQDFMIVPHVDQYLCISPHCIV